MEIHLWGFAGLPQEGGKKAKFNVIHCENSDLKHGLFAKLMSNFQEILIAKMGYFG